MPAVQPNWNYYTYVSDDGTTYNMRAREEWVAAGGTGLTTRTVGAPRYIASRSQSPRKFIYRDATTFRTFSGPVGTAAAYASATLGSTVSVAVQGESTLATYTLVKKVNERVPTSIVGRQDPDHA